MPEAKKPIVFSEGLMSASGTLYLIVLFSAGFLTNFVSLGSINTGTILLYLLAYFLTFIGALSIFGPLQRHIAVVTSIVLVLSCVVLVKAALDSNQLSQRIGESIIYFLGVWPTLFFMQANTENVRQRFLKVLAIGLFGLSAFAIIQSVFASSLPLSLFVLRGDPAFGVGEQLFRPTGLTGNPIVFSSIMVFASAYFAALWFERHRIGFFLALVCSLVANYLTYTRASIVLVIPVLAFVWLFHRRFHVKHKILALVVVMLAIAGGQYLFSHGENILLIQRLQSSNSESLKSTVVHFQQIQDAENAVASHPLAGVGIGSQGSSVGPENVIIADGAWWILFLEFGIPLSVLMVILLFVVLTPLAKYVLRKDSKNRALAIATLSFHAYILPANFINSAILGHISFGLYWMVLGLSLAGISSNYTSSFQASDAEHGNAAAQNDMLAHDN